MIRKVLIANRGEIAVRIIRACKELGIKTVAIYSEVDKNAIHTELADEAICVGTSKSKDSYLNESNILSAAVITGCNAIHPGFGFLSENASFAGMCEECNIKFIGPSKEIINIMGNKSMAREIMKNANIPIIPGSEGLIRNLEPWEILDQIIKIQEDTGKRVSNLVLMGSGEPLDNFENTKQFLKIVNDKNGLNIGYRHITLSTCGVIPKMYELADLNIPINLALSLHSPFDEKRAEIMPVAKAYKVKDLIKACQNYIDKTNRRVTFEYSLIKGVNDSKAESDEISRLLKGMLCHVNLIPINKVEERDFERPDKTYIYKFRDALEKNKIPTTVRNSMGSDIGGACGQLRRKHK